ncbi:MAG: HPP family protein [Pseudomonadales bacterium]|nr:HPP family protein [Pseudomonadales bacterium]
MIMLSLHNWDFLIAPTLLGAVGLVIVGLIFNNCRKGKHYPQYWY